MKTGRLVLAVVLLALIGSAGWLLFAPEETEQRGRRGGFSISVISEPVIRREFNDIVEALGTARARESVTLTARVTDTVKTVHFDDGQRVNKGDLLVELVDVEEQALLKEAQANLFEAETQFSRTEDLVASGNASTAALDAQRRRVSEARYRFAATEARLADRRVTAPFDGVLGIRQVSAGSLINQGTPITTIDDIDIINLDFSVPERFLSSIGPGQSVNARVEAYPDRVFVGTIKTIDSRVDPVTRSVLVRAQVDNKEGYLRPGLLMILEVVSRTWQGLSIPEHAVVPSGGRNYVFEIVDGKANRVEVELGIRRPGYVEVVSGVDEGARIVTEGTLRLGRSGVPVKDGAEDIAPKPDASGRPSGRPQ